MTDVQEVFLEQPLTNGLEENIKNGDIFNGNLEVTEESNGFAKDSNGNCETEEMTEEKLKHNDEDSKIDDVSENISEEQLVLKKIEPEEDISVSVPIKPDENSGIEELRSINKEEEPVKSPTTQNNVSKLQENTKEIPSTAAELTSQTDKCDSEKSTEKKESENAIKIDDTMENKLTDNVINLDKNITKIDECVEKEHESIKVGVDEAIENKTDAAETAEDTKKIDESAKSEHETDAAKTIKIAESADEPDPIITDEAIENETVAAETIKIVESVEEPDPMITDETIENGTDAAKTIKIAESAEEPDPMITDETIENGTDAAKTIKNAESAEEPDPMITDQIIESETDDVKISDNSTEINVLVDFEDGLTPRRDITKKTTGVLSNETDNKETISDDSVVKIPESAEPIIVDNGNHSKDKVDKCQISETAGNVIETPMETDVKKPSASTITNSTTDNVIETTTPIENLREEAADIPAEKPEGVIEIDCKEKVQVINADRSDKEIIPKDDKVPDAIFNFEDSSDGCTFVETKENAATPDTQKMDVDTPLENTESESKKSDTDGATDDPKCATTSLKQKTISGLSNTLDIISDDEDESPLEAVSETITQDAKVKSSDDENKCINLDDDDDIMLIDEEPNKDNKDEEVTKEVDSIKPVENVEVSKSPPLDEDNEAASKLEELLSQDNTEESVTAPVISEKEMEKPDISDKTDEKIDVKPAPDTKPLVPANFLKTFKSNVAEMTRDDLEEFCLIKIVEGIVEKSNLTEIKSKLKTMAQNVEEWRKKSMMLTKQNRDLQIVLQTVQEEQKKKPDQPITPLKITRSVGMQVFMTEANERGVKRGRPPAVVAMKAKPLVMTRQSPKSNNNAPIPVPRLVPATGNSPAKPRVTTLVQSSAISSNTGKPSSTPTVKTPPVKQAEKRPLSSVPMSFTVDLTDDEPPAKQMPPRQAPVRVVAQQHLLAPRAPVGVNSPRKVYIPINSQNQNQLRQGNAIMLRAVTPLGPRQRPPMVRLPNNSTTTVRPMRGSAGRHPAPLPDVAKQQQPPNWKALPPSPDLKISKVENGIVISWKIEGYQEDSYEDIASYQLYAYQETSSPPNTLLWKKIGDVKALPLPMACTLTQFMAGYKYYFAVRAVDIRSRIGPFSLPGSILLLNK